MNNLQDIINLCKNEQGKVFVMDEQGNVQLVVMGIDLYQKLSQKKVVDAKIPDPEIVNRKIIKAQLEETIAPAVEDFPLHPVNTVVPRSTAPKAVDMREEVIDPSFDFDTPVDDLS